MGASQRNKGAAFERWVAKELTEELGLSTPLRRNLEQYQTALSNRVQALRKQRRWHLVQGQLVGSSLFGH